MEDLIWQAFLSVDILGDLVREGRYDLIDPDGHIIPRADWETIIKPGMLIVMKMRPLVDRPQPGGSSGIPLDPRPTGLPHVPLQQPAEAKRPKARGLRGILNWMAGSTENSTGKSRGSP